MNIDAMISYFPILLGLLVAGIFAYVYFKSYTPLSIEKGQIPRYSERCTSYLDGLKNIFTRFVIYDDFVVISSRKKIVLKFEEIIGVDMGRVWGAKSLDIKHHRKNTPSISLLLNDLATPMDLIENKLRGRTV